MIERRGELVLTIIIAFGLLGGLAWDFLGEGVPEPEPKVASGSLFYERAVFCPPRPKGLQGNSSVVTWAQNGEDANVSIGGKDEREVEAAELPGGSELVEDLETSGPVDVIGSGSPLLANVNMAFKDVRLQGSGPFNAVGSAPCSAQADSDWYFPEGSSDFRYDERLLIYNPFPDEAVVRITFVTPQGEEAKAGLARVPVPSGESTEVEINKVLTQKAALGAHISAIRGRVVAWKMMFASPEDREPGAEFSLGATEVGTRAFFPAGQVDDGSTSRITILNPSDEEAQVNVSFITPDGPVQPNQFVGLKVPRHSMRVVSLGSLAGKKAEAVGSVATKIESANGVGVIAEQSTMYGSGAFTGFGSEFGSAEPSESWWVAPAAAVPTADALVLLNLGPKPAHIDVSLLSPDGSTRSPASLQGITVPTGKRGFIQLGDEVDGEALVARLDADQPIVVSRLAQGNGDLGLVAGVAVAPATQTGP